MPNQKLPQPNIPGQNATQTNDDQDKTTHIFPKTTPGVSSRENPAGRPPEKPTLVPDKPLTDPVPQDQLSQATDSVSAGGIDPSLIGKKVSMPKDLANSAEQKVQLPQPFVPNEMKASAKPIIAPAGRPLTTGATLSKEEVSLTRPSSAPEPAEDDKKPDEADAKAKKPPAPPKKKLTPKTIALIVLPLLILGVLGFFVYKNFFAKNNVPQNQGAAPSGAAQPVEIIDITYWGLWEDGEILNDVFDDFEAQEGIRVDYRKQSHRDYRERLEQALSSSNGPDVFRYHMTWVPMLTDRLAALPTNIMTSAEYQQTFYPISFETLQSSGRIVGIPLMYDGLALFYNKEILRNANLSVPTTWSELRGTANQLTVPGNVSTRRDDNITQAGLAIGNASNVEHFADILALLILQNGGDLTEPTSQNVVDALTFYTNFIKQDKVWSNNLPNSTVAFARGEVAMIFAPSWRALEIKQINPNLDFAVARVPQLSSEENIAWATFWAEGVSKNSTKQEAAWKLLKYLSSPEVLRKFYNSASLIRPFGEIYPRPDMASELSDDEYLAAFIDDAPDAKSLPMASFTHDNGVNDQLIQYYADAINAVLAGDQPLEALEDVEAGINQVVVKYSLN
ncbi:MAG: extracellular solute-binding protein [Candidatus Pacebacteria bacterium]|nr:extracellular solute-binding protein [Candidatus Paceibacterota bacterium]